LSSRRRRHVPCTSAHALDHTLIDALVRRRRMQVYNTCCLTGHGPRRYRHAELVERIWPRGPGRHDLGREAFGERVGQVSRVRRARSAARCGGAGQRDWSPSGSHGPRPVPRGADHRFNALSTTADYRRTDHQLSALASPTAIPTSEVRDHLTRRRARLDPLRRRENSIGPPPRTRPDHASPTPQSVHPNDPRYTEPSRKTVELPLTGRRIPIGASRGPASHRLVK